MTLVADLLSVTGEPVYRVVAVQDALVALKREFLQSLCETLLSARSLRRTAVDGQVDLNHESFCICIATSLPDYSEFASSMSLETWKEWFISAAAQCLRCCCSQTLSIQPRGETKTTDGCCIFYQTDIVVEGVHISKSFLLMKASERVSSDIALRWHKIACRAPPGAAAGGSVTSYSHVLCFSRSPFFSQSLERSCEFPDVLPLTGGTSWARGTGANSSLMISKFIAKSLNANGLAGCLFDPFCGHGSLLAAANAAGIDSIGVELSCKRARRAARIRLVEMLGPGSKKGNAAFQFDGDRKPELAIPETERGISK
jgi:hypothetical protein